MLYPRPVLPTALGKKPETRRGNQRVLEAMGHQLTDNFADGLDSEDQTIRDMDALVVF